MKYSILITAAIILIFLIVTILCLLRCISAKREAVTQAVIKAKQVALTERSSVQESMAEGQQISANTIRKLMNESQRSQRKGKKSTKKAKGNEDAVNMAPVNDDADAFEAYSSKHKSSDGRDSVVSTPIRTERYADSAQKLNK